MLSSGISEAMNCTAFGLIVAVTCMVFHTLFSNRNAMLARRLDEAVVRVMNYVKRNPNAMTELAALMGHESLDAIAVYPQPSKEDWTAGVERGAFNVDR